MDAPSTEIEPAQADAHPPPGAGASREPAQLTVRAIVVGMLIGAVMCLSNIYVFFKTGWSLGVTLTACILAFSVFQALSAARIARRPLGALENNALTTVASGAGYMTGGGNMAAFGALLMVTTARPSGAIMIAWFAGIAALGVLAAIPIKRQLIDVEDLAFPTGRATAETIRSIHATGGAGASKARSLAIAAMVAAVLAFLRDAKAKWMPFNVPGSVDLPLALGGRALKDWTIALKTELVLVAAGGLMSFRTGWSLLLGGGLTYVVLAPALLAQGAIKEAGYKAIVAWTLWPGAAILVGSGLTSFAFDYKSVVRRRIGPPSIRLAEAHEDDDQEFPPGPGGDQGGGYKAIVAWTLWPGAAILVGSGLTSFAFDYKSVARSFAGLGALLRRRPATPSISPAAASDEAPSSWFPGRLPRDRPRRRRAGGLPLPHPGLGRRPRGAACGADGLRGRARPRARRTSTPTKALGPVTPAPLRRDHARQPRGQHHVGQRHGRRRPARGGSPHHAQDRQAPRRERAPAGARAALRRHRGRAGGRARVPTWIIIPDPSVLGSDAWSAPSVASCGRASPRRSPAACRRSRPRRRRRSPWACSSASRSRSPRSSRPSGSFPTSRRRRGSGSPW